ncbi:2-succinyl-5-enolpyruvyl-6-hydroxy-3-cyclohexene-1-carboxylic-acid synthase [Serratia microhaemolytica]|uniref:2-succinyl-5-enolpyruvyl-6-hydroxy-3- cyclohexene-1-carboxylic-acid synthase n=1 Tax=Serratia microhaemolytica TaxID=2675110 RepID=UPI000FDEE6FF|nr:2-succinyl-5-enolpyruvyl-6-hydroxy-3-cyclohexene-1-carboxylic-acid synthase [Serratia microhaemolytica]
MSTSVFNRRWAALLLEALARHGVRHVCIAPGSRSAPLTLAAADSRKFICHTHFDERGLAHLALGLAKASAEPVAIIVTSGTAAANLYPALIEAGLTGERLVLLTADRPVELIDCGANQAIRQTGLYASHAKQTIELPRPSPEIPARWLVSVLDSAMAQLSHGGLHINCPFAEPLYGGDQQQYAEWSAALGDWWQQHRPWLLESVAQPISAELDWPVWRQKRGVVIAGRLKPYEGELLANWAATLGWPLIGDLLSQTGQPLPCADLWLAHPQAGKWLSQAELVLQVGSRLTGKRLLQWQATCQPAEYWLIDPLPGRLDPAHHRGRRICADIAQWLALHPPQSQPAWASGLTELASKSAKLAANHVAEQFGEAQLAQRLPQLLAEQGQLFVGNSLIVRLIDALAQLPVGYPVFSNRGASGIDGLISTAAGVQRANQKPTLVIIGDLSALYDLNALALLRDCTTPLLLLVINNNGGQIFSLLPTPEAQRQRFFCMPQHIEFSHAAAMFHLQYARVENWCQLEQAVEQGWQHQGASLIEVTVAASEGAESLRQLVNLLASGQC